MAGFGANSFQGMAVTQADVGAVQGFLQALEQSGRKEQFKEFMIANGAPATAAAWSPGSPFAQAGFSQGAFSEQFAGSAQSQAARQAAAAPQEERTASTEPTTQQFAQAAKKEEPEERGILSRVFGSAWAGTKAMAGAAVGLKAASKVSGKDRSLWDYTKAIGAAGFGSWLDNITSDTGNEGGFVQGAGAAASMEFLSRNDDHISFKSAALGAAAGAVEERLADWGWDSLKSMIGVGTPKPRPGGPGLN